MIKLCYVSDPVGEFTREELDTMLHFFRKKNRSLGITGLLLYRARSFCQFLEGEEAVVTALFNQIRSDNRHRNVALVYQEPIESRSFSGWSMKFEVLEGNEKFKLSNVWPDTLPPKYQKVLRQLTKQETAWQGHHK
ncbi:MAG: BLUF domain-containing protein [Hylemonella sp.]